MTLCAGTGKSAFLLLVFLGAAAKFVLPTLGGGAYVPPLLQLISSETHEDLRGATTKCLRFLHLALRVESPR